MTGPVISQDRRRRYVVVAVFLAVWAAVLIALTLRVVPDTYWYSYYAIDYTVGFVRRGLAGELVALLPGENLFFEQQVGRWVSTVAFVLALAVLAWWIAVRSGRSERRVQMGFLVVVLPFGFAFGLLQPGSTLFGAAAVVLFGVAVASVESDRGVLVTSAVFGVVAAVLTLVHEAIPFLFGLGVIVTLVVVANQLGREVRWASIALALGPALVTALVVAVLGKHGIADQLCALVPHGEVNNPLAGKPTMGQLLTGYRFTDDYHAWTCRNITPFYNRDFGDAVRYVGRLGAAGMIVNTLFGIGLFGITIVAIGRVTGVAPSRIWALFRLHGVAIAIGACLTVPVFLTGVDWVRWWVNISLDIGVAYLLYASRQPEVDAPPTRQSMRAFMLVVIGLALIPVGIVPAFLAPLPI